MKRLGKYFRRLLGVDDQRADVVEAHLASLKGNVLPRAAAYSGDRGVRMAEFQEPSDFSSFFNVGSRACLSLFHAYLVPCGKLACQEKSSRRSETP